MINLCIGTMVFASMVTGVGLDLALGMSGGYLIGSGVAQIFDKRRRS